MPIEADFTEFYRDAVTVEPWTGQDSYRKPTYGAAVTYRARVVGRRRLARDDQGQEALSTKQVWLLSDANVSPKDRVTLPAGESPQAPPILEVRRVPDELGAHHVVLLLA